MGVWGGETSFWGSTGSPNTAGKTRVRYLPVLTAEWTTADLVQVLWGKHPNEINTVTGNSVQVQDTRLIAITVLLRFPVQGPVETEACAAMWKDQLHSHICSTLFRWICQKEATEI